ncbi:MAG: response regulator [Fimbriimonadales bacterium]|nr:response regulator [Fimbriimonadales bacterium]
MNHSDTEGALLRVLMIEDSEDDARLILRELRREGFYVEHLQVTKPEDVRNALRHAEWDLVTSDHQMPGFDAPTAVRLVREMRPNLPLIIVSGQIDLPTAVGLMKEGADDYVQKDQLAMLGPSVRSALALAQKRRELEEAAAILRASERRFRSYFELPLVGLATTDNEGAIVDANDKLAEMAGLARSSLIRQPWIGLFRTSDAAGIHALVGQCLEFEREGFVAPAMLLRRGGSPLPVLVSGRAITQGPGEAVSGLLWVVVDVSTESKALRRLTDSHTVLAALSELGGYAIAVDDPSTGERLFEHVPQGLESCAIAADGFPQERVHPEHLPAFLAEFGPGSNGGSYLVFQARSREGSWLPVALRRDLFHHPESDGRLLVTVCRPANTSLGALVAIDDLPIPAALANGCGRIAHANAHAQEWSGARIHPWPVGDDRTAEVVLQGGTRRPVLLTPLGTRFGRNKLHLVVAVSASAQATDGTPSRPS